MPKSGFTLLELLVSMAILGILAISLFTLLNRASSSFDLGDASLQADQTARAVLDRMQRELQTTMVDNASNIYFYGQNDELYFIYYHYYFSANDVDGYAEVGYRLDTSATYLHNHFIERYYQEPADADFSFEPWDGSFFTRYADAVTDLTFEYWDDATSPPWKTTWDSRSGGSEEDTLPSAVAITVETIDRNQAIKYSGNATELNRAKKSYRTVVYLPQSSAN